MESHGPVRWEPCASFSQDNGSIAHTSSMQAMYRSSVKKKKINVILGKKRMQCHFLELEHGWVVLQVNYRSVTVTIVLKKSNNMKDNTTHTTVIQQKIAHLRLKRIQNSSSYINVYARYNSQNEPHICGKRKNKRPTDCTRKT